MKKKIFLFLAFVTALIVLLTVSASATTYRGSCGKDGDNLTWTFDTGTGELAITGTGEMNVWTSFSKAPWYSYRSNIKTIRCFYIKIAISDDHCKSLKASCFRAFLRFSSAFRSIKSREK